MSDETLTFVVPLPPNRANARGHWRTIHAQKKAYWHQLDLLAGMIFGTALRVVSLARDGAPPYVMPNRPPTPWPAAVIAVTFYVVREMDDDNAPNRAKWLLDWLVTRGYVVDDNRHALQWAGFPKQVKCKRAEVRVELTLTKRAPQERAA